MATLFANFLAGTTTDNPLTNVATTINSAGFANLPTVTAPDIMYLVLDPDASAGAPEIVTVTAHTAAATSVTVTRGSQSTVARQHASGTVWRATVTKADMDAIQAFMGPGAIGTTQLADNSVTSAKIALGAVGTTDIADDAVTQAKIGPSAVGTTELADDAVTDAKIGAPTTGEIGSTNIMYARYGNLVAVWTKGAASEGTLPVGFRPASTVWMPVLNTATGQDYTGTISTGGVIDFGDAGSPFNGVFSVVFSTV